jgi:hypothetical protein
MRIREFITSGKHYTNKKLCTEALQLFSDNLPIESLHTSYNATENNVSAWFTFTKVSSCFKVEFLEMSDLLDFLDSLNLGDKPNGATLGQSAESVYEDLQKILAENA